MTLPFRNQTALKALIADVSNPASPDYGQYLTPAQFDSQFAPTAAQVQQVRSFLTSEGVTVGHVSSNNMVIDATGTVAQAQKAFDTTIGKYYDSKLKRNFIANESALTVPSSVAPDILGVVGLDTHYLRSTPPVPQANPLVGAGPDGGYTPSQLTTAYDVNPLATAGDTGTGQKVGLFELATYKQSNITTYDNEYGLGSASPTISSVDGGNTTLGDAEVEVELDIEVVQALAPKSTITVFEAPNSDQGVIDGYNAIATSDTTLSNSTSWGECEADSSTATINSEDQIFEEMASQGQTLYAASGDSAAYDCGTSGQLAVDNPADDPYVTGAGGTHLNINSSNGYTSETPWDTSATEGGGGGVSTIFARPSWQTGDGVSTSTCSKRCVPDISGDADPATGYAIYTQGAWTVVGGTSAAAPLWAGFTADYNQDATASGKAKLGYANPTLYSLAGTTQTYAPFHDITTGHTSTATNWPAATGYDLATGIGSYDAYNFARDLIGGGTTTNDFSISDSPTSVTAAQGASASTTVSTAVTSGSAQSVALSATGLPTGASATFTPTSVTAGSSSTLSLTAGASTPAGSYTVTVTGTGASATHSTTVTFVVTSSGTTTNDFSISDSPTSVTAAQGASASTTVSTAVTSGSAQSVVLSATGLPTGASATFTPTSVTAGSSSTLKLTAGASTPAGSYTVTVTGTGASATHSTTVTFVVTTSGGGSVQVVSNGGFETGTASPWTLSSGVLNNDTTDEPAHSGSWDAWFDGYGSTHTDTATQSVTIPAGKSSAVLQFYLHIDTAETTKSTAYDKFTVKIGSTTLATFSNLNAASGYTVHSYTVPAADIGTTQTLTFTGTEDSSLQTSFVLDDVTLTAS